MKRRSALLASFALAWVFLTPLLAQLERVGPKGGYACGDPDGEVIPSPYPRSAADTTKVCVGYSLLESLFGMSIAEAQARLRGATAGVPTLPAGWTQGEYFGSADPHTSGTTAYVSATTTFSATNIDGRFYYTDDSGAVWVYTPAAADDFTVTVRLDALNFAAGTKAFLQIRDENAANSAHCGVEVLPDQWIVTCRNTAGGETSIPFSVAGSPVVGGCLRVSNDGSQDSLLFEYSTDDGAANDCSNATYSTVQGGQVFAGWASTNDTKYVVMSCASINPNRPTPCASAFSAVTTSNSAVTHPGGQATVGWSPAVYSFNEDAGTVALTATLTGTNSAGCTITVNSANGTAIAGTDFTAISAATLTWTSGQTGDRTQNLVITDRAGVQSPQDRDLTVVLTKNTCTAPTLVNSTATVTIRETDSSVPGTGVIWISDNEGKATVAGATEAIKDANLLAIQFGEPGVDPGNGQLCWPEDDTDCAPPNVYAFLSNDSGNGGPSAARAGSYFMKLRRNPLNQQVNHWSIGGNEDSGNRVLVEDQARSFCLQRQACWGGFSVWIPSSINAVDFVDNQWSFFAGIHQPWPKPTSLYFELNDLTGSNDFAIRSRTYAGDCCLPTTGPYYFYDVETGAASYDGTRHYEGVIARDEWVDFVYKIVFDERVGGLGELDVWQTVGVTTTKIVDYTGPIGYKIAANDLAGYQWFGRYTHGVDTVLTTYYYDEMRTGDATSSQTDVDPESYD